MIQSKVIAFLKNNGFEGDKKLVLKEDHEIALKNTIEEMEEELFEAEKISLEKRLREEYEVVSGMGTILI